MGTYTPTPIAGLAPTNAAEYAEETVVPPGITAAGTTLNCGKWILVQAGDYCQALSLSNGISLDLFYLINPSIHKPACDNLIPGLYYCAQPTYRWNVTDDNSTAPIPTAVPAPGPTPSGTTLDCTRWYQVQPGDNCFLIEQSMDKLVSCNPIIDSSCSNLLADTWYCVACLSSGVPSTTSAAPPTSMPSTPPPPLPSSTAPPSTCGQTYTVRSGDTCFAI
ncbi:hypothetical protein M432DRAFT_637042 [Thermoascus aurantiacus ATCC 26904]